MCREIHLTKVRSEGYGYNVNPCSCKVGDYNGLYQQNCLLTVTNRYNQNYMIYVSENKI